MKTLMITIVLISKVFHFEVAVTEKEKMRGLMYRHAWNQSDGMIFVNRNPRQVTFWMKNTYLRLTLFYLDSKCNILEIYEPKSLSTDLIPSKSNNVRYVLELNPIYTPLILSNYTKFRIKLLYRLTNTLSSLEQ